jgi:hypothetical protein
MISSIIKKVIRGLYEEISPMPSFQDSRPPILLNLMRIRESMMDIGEKAADIAELTIDRTYIHN